MSKTAYNICANSGSNFLAGGIKYHTFILRVNIIVNLYLINRIRVLICNDSK